MFQNTTKKYPEVECIALMALQAGTCIFPMSPDYMRLYFNHRWHPPSKIKIKSSARKKIFFGFLDTKSFTVRI